MTRKQWDNNIVTMKNGAFNPADNLGFTNPVTGNDQVAQGFKVKVHLCRQCMQEYDDQVKKSGHENPLNQPGPFDIALFESIRKYHVAKRKSQPKLIYREDVKQW